jgi:lauroyl/myristoyl acyltransferase
MAHGPAQPRLPQASASQPERKPTLAHRLQYIAFLAAERLLRLLSLDTLYRLGYSIGWIISFIPSPARRLAAHNLQIALGKDHCPAQLRQILRQHFARLGANLVCGLKLPLMDTAEVRARVHIHGQDIIRLIDTQNPNTVFAVSHLSCWELLTQVPAIFENTRPRGSIYQALANPLLDKLLLQRRIKLGYRLFDRAAGFVPQHHNQTNTQFGNGEFETASE